MSLVAWSNITFVEPSDLGEKEIGGGSILLSYYTPDIVEQVIGEGKDQLLTDLQSDLPELFASRNGQFQIFDSFLREIGYSYTDLDTMFDKIGNPDVLKSCARAKVIMLLWMRLTSEDTPKLNFNLAYGKEQFDSWKKLYTERYTQAKKRLWLDLNEDGLPSDQERVRTKTNFVRA